MEGKLTVPQVVSYLRRKIKVCKRYFKNMSYTRNTKLRPTRRWIVMITCCNPTVYRLVRHASMHLNHKYSFDA
jgi:hypothetical protein